MGRAEDNTGLSDKGELSLALQDGRWSSDFKTFFGIFVLDILRTYLLSFYIHIKKFLLDCFSQRTGKEAS
jgi:hypothetical protein